MSVALLQGNIEQSLKFDPARYAHTLETYARLAEQAQAPLIVFPETVVPYYPYFSFIKAPAAMGADHLLLYEQAVTIPPES